MTKYIPFRREDRNLPAKASRCSFDPVVGVITAVVTVCMIVQYLGMLHHFPHYLN